MNHEARVIRIRRLTEAVNAEIMKLRVPPSPEPGSHRHNELSAKVEGWQQQARLIERDLKSQAHLAAMQRPAAGHGSQAYRARQSADSRMARVDDLMASCAEFSAALAELAALLHGPQNAEHAILNALKTGLKQIQKDAKAGKQLIGHELTHISQQAATVSARSGGPGSQEFSGSGMASPVGVLMVGLAMIAALKTRLGKR